jgi:hypothetical protein
VARVRSAYRREGRVLGWRTAPGARLKTHQPLHVLSVDDGPFDAKRFAQHDPSVHALGAERNRESGHGQGPEPKSVPNYVAAYALHATAANILFLVEAHRAK